MPYMEKELDNHFKISSEGLLDIVIGLGMEALYGSLNAHFVISIREYVLPLRGRELGTIML